MISTQMQFRPVFPALIFVSLSLFAGMGWSAGACGAESCKPESRHEPSWIVMVNGMGGSKKASTVASLADAAGEACNYFADAHSDEKHVMAFVECAPVLPPQGGVGWPRSSIGVRGTIETRRKSDGMLVSSSSGVWGMLSLKCDDKATPAKTAVGNDGMCYCKQGLDWLPGEQACGTVQKPTLRRK